MDNEKENNFSVLNCNSQAVFCNLTTTQVLAYENLLASILAKKGEPKGKKVLSDIQVRREREIETDCGMIREASLSFIQKLMKLCNHPLLIDESTTAGRGKRKANAMGDQKVDYSVSGKMKFLVKYVGGNSRLRSNSVCLVFLFSLLYAIGADKKGDRIVIVSSKLKYCSSSVLVILSSHLVILSRLHADSKYD